LTLGWRISFAAGADPADVETSDVERTLALTASVRRIGGTRLLWRRLNWDRLFSSANPPGAMAPKLARSQLTRQAKKEDAARRSMAADARRRAFEKLVRACA
jgi:hypothetical protein